MLRVIGYILAGAFIVTMILLLISAGLAMYHAVQDAIQEAIDRGR